MLTHKCEKYKEILDFFENNDALCHYEWGTAIKDNFTNYGDSEFFWATNDEYSSPILFCPYCGLNLRTLLKEIK